MRSKSGWIARIAVAAVVVCGVVGSAAGQTDITEKFKDENFRAWVYNWVGKTAPAPILDSDVNDITILNVRNRGVSDLSGVECFTALKELSCDSNQLTTLDVSNNTALTNLSCDKNQLTALDVSKNTKLDTLSCHSNQLTTLDVSKNTKLTRLNLGGNPLTTLDVSKNTELTSLSIWDNQLTTLDVSKNTKLTYLFCVNSQLTTLDVSKNTKLTYLFCVNSQLTTLDVSKNTALTALECGSNQLTTLDVSKNTALLILHCYSNQLTTLDVSENTKLVILGCYSNQLTTLDVSKNTELGTLECNQNQLTTLDVSKNTKLTRLDVRENYFTSVNNIIGLNRSKLSVFRFDPQKIVWVIFDSQGGSVVSSQLVDGGTKAVKPTDPTRFGYILGGWYRDTECTGTAWNFDTDIVTANITLYAKWTLNTYTITWNVDGGTPVPTQTSVTHGSSITAPAAMTKICYTFGGWYTNYGLTTAATFPMENVTESKTFYAKWTLNTYAVKWEANGGTPVPTQTSVSCGGSITEPSATAKAGYNIGGWYTNSTLTEAVTFPITNVTEPKTFYAKWIPVFTITFNATGGTVTPASGATRADSTIFSLPTPERGDYAFNGWFTAETGGEKITESRKYSANATIYAQWTQSVYTVTLDPAGGTVTPLTVRIGESGRIVSLPTPEKAGYHFDDWFTATTGGERVTEGYTISQNVTIYAQWIPIYTITFDAVGGTVTPEIGTTNPDGNLVSLPTPTKAGYTFNEWLTAAADGEKVTESTVFTDNSTIYAKWTYNAVTDIINVPNAIKINEQFQLTGTVVPENAARNTIVWSVENAGTTNAGIYDGVFFAMSEGPIVLKATIADGKDVGVPYEQFFFINAVVSVASPARVIPSSRPDETTSISPVSPLTVEFTAGPNPVSKSSGKVRFFRNGSRVSYATLSIYDASGNVVRKIRVIDDAVGSQTRRKVSSWDLRDANGRFVSDGTYVVRGTVKTKDGKREKVSLVVGVR